MGKRVSTRGLSKDRVYILKTAARIIGVSEATFRRWPKEGLRIISDQRPYLVRGADLIAFLKKREAANKVIMQEGQFYCMHCKAPTNPRNGSATFRQSTALTGRLSAVCGVCGGKVGRFCSVVHAAETLGMPAVALSAVSQA